MIVYFIISTSSFLAVLKSESDRIKRTLNHLVSSTEKEVVKSLKPKKMIQAVKAICTLLGKIETLDVSTLF